MATFIRRRGNIRHLRVLMRFQNRGGLLGIVMMLNNMIANG